MKRFALIAVIGLLSFSTFAKEPIMINEPYEFDYGEGCIVTVYETEAQAKKGGELEEICVIEGTSSGSFKHTTDTAIRKHAKKAYRCGVDKVYVQTRAKMGWSVAKASMVGFKYVNGKQNDDSDTTSYITEPSVAMSRSCNRAWLLSTGSRPNENCAPFAVPAPCALRVLELPGNIFLMYS